MRLVREKHSALGKIVEQVDGAQAVMIVTGPQGQFDRKTVAIHDGMDLCGQPSAGST